MRERTLLLLLAAVAGGLSVAAGAGSAATRFSGHVVFVQTDQASGNRVVSYDVSGDGRLVRAGSFATGGLGGVAAPGSEADHLASQGSLVYDGAHKLLIAVNAGSNTVSTFSVGGDQLRLENIVPSGGEFPVSIAVHGDLVYVLNSGGTGIVQGFLITDRGLQAIADSARSLGLANGNPPNFLEAPGQVGFNPSGSQLLVTTKASGNAIDVFSVAASGTLSAHPVTNPSATPVPFAFTFTPSGRLALAEAGAATLSTYTLNADGALGDARSLGDGQAALCWIERVGDFYYVSNTGSADVSAYTLTGGGQPTLVGTTGVVATTEPGPIDQTSPPGTRLVYVETGSGTIHGYRSNPDGTLTGTGTTSGLPAGIQGITST